MADPSTPVLDDHLHLHPEGKGVEAAREFARAGGTHLLVVNRPSWHVADEAGGTDAFRATFEATLDLVEAADGALPGRAWAVLGVHPALVTHLVEKRGWSVQDAAAAMAGGLDLAATYVEAGEALALKSGRPHYEVDDAVWEASNGLIRHALALAGEADCALQLHTEATDDLTGVARWADRDGPGADRVVKHFSTGPVDGAIPSVIAREDPIDAIIEVGGPFMLETDFLDDPSRPGAVLGPKLVPRRSRELAERGATWALRVAHVETPAAVYGIDTVATFDR